MKEIWILIKPFKASEEMKTAELIIRVTFHFNNDFIQSITSYQLMKCVAVKYVQIYDK